MKTIITGSHTLRDPEPLHQALSHCSWPISMVLCGQEPGVDALAAKWAETNNKALKTFPARILNLGGLAWRVRNDQMLEHAEALVLVWAGFDRELGRLLGRAREKGLQIHELVTHE